MISLSGNVLIKQGRLWKSALATYQNRLWILQVEASMERAAAPLSFEAELY